MILKREKEKKFRLRGLLWALPLLIILGLFSQTTRTPNIKDSRAEVLEPGAGDKILFTCDLESNDGVYFKTGEQLFDGLEARSSEHAHSGKYSIALNSQNVFGLTTWFKPPSYDITYHLKVHRYNPHGVDSYLVVAAPNDNSLYQSVKEGNLSGEDPWETLDLLFQVPPNIDSFKIYCYVEQGLLGDVYFDDLTLSVQNIESVSQEYNIPSMVLRIEEQSLNKLKQKRSEAWSKGVLVKDDDDWVKAKVRVDQQDLTARIRLKGDWLDHLRGDKWSFRIKLKDPNALWGMITFNLQKPDTRGNLKEWIYHQMLNEHQILSPRYEFVLLSLNGKNLGFYAIEEHFEKELVESQSRRQGPIFKFSEDRLWEGVKRQFTDVGKDKIPLEYDKQNAFRSAAIEAFGVEDYQTNPDLKRQYLRGLQLMSMYKTHQAPLDQIFDTDLLGKYLAIIDLCGAYHNLTWHNQRWYYNPLSDLLEPIGFDGFTAEEPTLSGGITLLSEEAYRIKSDAYEPYKRLFSDAGIVASYSNYLDSLSRVSYLDSFFSKHNFKIQVYARGLEDEYSDAVFDRQAYYKRAAEIRLTIPAFSESAQFYHTTDHQLYIINNHVLPIETIEESWLGKIKVNAQIWPTTLSGKGQFTSDISRSNSVKFRVIGQDTILTALVRESDELISLSKPISQPSSTLHPLCTKEGDHYILLSGKTDIPIVVPKGAALVVSEGAQLNLLAGAYLSCSGPIIMKGTEESPIRIHSDDGTGAIFIHQTEDRSSLEHVIFEHLGRLDHLGHVLTGGVTFYEAAADFRSCVFRQNTQEDALNMVRSDFYLQKCVFEETAFDAFDADFCTGTLQDCYFRSTGNDAIDFSGSQATIKDCFMQDIGDKALSVGEHSTVHVTRMVVNRATIGVASKDLSTLTIDFIDLKNVGTGFTAYQKKPSFGPAMIIVHDYQVKNTPRLQLIERNSTLSFVTDSSSI